jgi:PAS domain S-box-containing protein
VNDGVSGRRPDFVLLEETADDLYEHAPCGYVSTTPDGTIVRVNQTFVDWTGHPRELLLTSRIQTFLAIGSRIYYETHYAPLLAMQREVREIALEFQRADGHVLPVLVNARQRLDAGGTPVFTRLTIFDASDRRRYERELLLARRKAERVAKDHKELVAMLSHDIRNPLNALMGYVQLLERTGLSETQARYASVMRAASETMLALLNRVLEMSRVESISIVDKPFSIRETVLAVISTYQGRAIEKGITVDARIAPNVPEQVVGDPVATRQILANLVANAVKFTERGAVTVTVDARDHSQGAVTLDVSVLDTGIGIPADAIGRIFDEFTQADSETALRFGGSGLGLAITRKLLALYDSTINVESRPGEGSRFFFSIRLQIP